MHYKTTGCLIGQQNQNTFVGKIVVTLKRTLFFVAYFCISLPLLSVGQELGETKLTVEIYVSEPAEINTTSALIKGPTELMVVSAQPNISAASRLVKEIKQTGLSLKYIFLTHAHLDHFQGASIILSEFPEAQFVATPSIAKLQHLRIEASDEIARSRYGDNAAVPSIPVTPFNDDKLVIDGMPVEIWTGYYGDVALGHPDEAHNVLYVPSAHTLIPSDIVYFDAHVMLGGTTKESREIWISQLEKWLDQDFDKIVPGHMPKDAPLTPNGALQHTIQYIKDYDKVLETHENAESVIRAMKEIYPDLRHGSALHIGTFIHFKVMHKLAFSSTLESVFSVLPSSLVRWINNKIYDQKKAEWNGEEAN